MRLSCSFIAHVTRLSFGLLLLSGMAVATRAQDKCAPVTEPMKKSLSEYLAKKFKLPAAMPLSVTEVTPVADTCYRKLRFESTNSQQPSQFILYLSPDRRFLSLDLSDTTVDPAEIERRETEQLRGVLVKGTLASLGPQDAPVTIVVFSDFQCPSCKTAGQVLREVALAEGKNVRLVFRHLPLRTHTWARPAAESTACVLLQSTAGFWQLHDLIFEHQQEITADNVQSKILEYVQTLPQVDATKYQACVADKAAAPLVLADVEFAKVNRLTATPTLFINGYKMQGVGNAEQLRNIIRQRLEHEQKLCTECK